MGQFQIARQGFEMYMLYFKECRPQDTADVLVDYVDLENPTIERRPS
jgi:hypothetical protein